MEISIVIPVYNSENSISLVVNGIIKILQGKYEFEIILVNDNSRDKSLEICKSLCDDFRFIRLLSFSKNYGQHSAIMAGFNYAHGDYVVCMDDDLQNPPEEIIKLIDKIKNTNYDVVFSKYEDLKESSFRKFGSKINNIMANRLIEKPKDIYLTNYYIIRKFVVKEMIKYKGPYPYIVGLIFRITINIGTVEVKHNERKIGKSNYNFKKLISVWLNGFTNFSIKPLRIATFLGFIISIISFAFMLETIIKKLLNPQIFIGWTSLIVAVMFFGGTQLIFIGIIGEYIGRVFLSINNKPQYVIKEKLNLKNILNDKE